MSSVLIHSYTILVETILAWYFFSNTLTSERVSKGKELLYYLSFALFGMVMAVLPFVPKDRMPFFMLILVLYTLVGNYLVYHPTWMKNLYISVLLYSPIVLTDVLGGGIVTFLGFSAQTSIELFAYQSSKKLLQLILLYVLVSFLNRNRYHVPLQHQALPLILCQIASAYICYQSFFYRMNEGGFKAVAIEVMCLLCINVILCVYVEKQKETYYLREQNQMAEEKLSIQQAYYQDVIERQEETRALWHDIKKHLLAMDALVQSGEYDKLRETYQEIQESYGHLERTVDVGNPVVDGILSYAVARTREERVRLNMDVWVDRDLGLSPSDLYVIIGNTVDNAVEACSCMPEEERAIHLILRQKNHMLFYELSNPFDATQERKPGKIRGYGLKNVERCVKNYRGEMDVRQESDRFLVSIRLSL